MEYYFAPMEGVTTSIYRRIHSAMFGGADRYYTPFFSPTSDHIFTPREMREIGKENNAGCNVVPQILTKSGEDFLWAAAGLRSMGYSEVNLNLGCPSATVTAKGKGAGLLRTREALERLLDTVYAGAEIRVSVKTRLGYADPAEFPALLELYNRYDVSELILHPRTRQELYEGEVHLDMYELATAKSRAKVCYNGNLFTPEDVAAFCGKYPDQQTVMIGRGAAQDPALFRRLKGGASASREELRAFHEALYSAYRAEFGHLNGMRRMKELWHYLIERFIGGEELRKKLTRTKDTDVFEDTVEAVFRTLPLKDEQ